MESRLHPPPLTRNLLFVACAGVFALASTDALAQTQSAQPKTKELQAVTVTGSRISNPNVLSPTPISVLTADDIKATGAINIGDLMATMPQLATSFTMGNSGRYIGTAGQTPLDLRNLGTSRTLVLVNGRRFVGSSAGDTSVDVNLLPADWIDRVEIITGGASAVYGADAVAGVVNFILKKDYRGANLHAQMGTSQHGGFNKGAFSLTGGTDFAQNRGNLAVSVEHSDQAALEFGDRFGNKAYRSILTPEGPTDSALYGDAGSYTNYAGGTFSLGSTSAIGKRYVFSPDHTVRHQNFSGAYDDTGACSACDRLDTNQVVQLQPMYRRTTLSSVGHFDITPEQHLYAEGLYSHVDVKKHGQPGFGSGSSAYVITRDNAYMTPGLAALMDANKLGRIKVSRFDTDAGLRGEDTGRNTTRGVIGATGVITGDWEYDASLNYGVSDETRHNLNNRIVDRFYASIDAVKDAKGNIVCRSSLKPDAINANTGDVLNPIALNGGCVPTSIFGAGAVNPAAAQWFNTTTTTTTKLTQFVGGGSVTNNNLFQMPFEAGAASLAAGVEFRRESSSQVTDALDVAGLTFLNAIPPSQGAYSVKEGYIETALPLLTGRPLAKNLTFDAAVRFSDYTTIGHTKAWRWGLDWSLDDNVRLRGTMSSAVRAPNIGELYSGQSQNYFSVTDPCSVKQLKNAPDQAIRRANCLALNVPAGWTSTNSATIEGLSGSNPNLKPEEGRTWTAGMVLTPQFLPGFGMTLDYWNIKLSDAITSIGGTDIANHCVDSTTGINNVYCPNARRDPVTHELAFITSVSQNIAAISTSGADVGVYYTRPLFGGKLRFNLDATKVIGYTSHPFQDNPKQAEQDNGTLGFPKWKAVLGTTYTYGDWAFHWATRYFSSMLRVSQESYRANPKQTTPIRAGQGFSNDVRVGYSFKSGWEAYVGVRNVFDRNPPVNLFGTGFGSALYDDNVIGRYYYTGFNYRF